MIDDLLDRKTPSWHRFAPFFFKSPKAKSTTSAHGAS